MFNYINVIEIKYPLSKIKLKATLVARRFRKILFSKVHFGTVLSYVLFNKLSVYHVPNLLQLETRIGNEISVTSVDREDRYKAESKSLMMLPTMCSTHYSSYSVSTRRREN